MSSELDLRGLHQPHTPDPAFVDALEKRLDAILAMTPDSDEASDGSDPLDLYPRAPETEPSRRRLVVRTVIGVAAAVALLVLGMTVPRDEPDAVEPPTAPIITPRANGWVAQEYAGLVILERPDTDVSVVVDGAHACPAFSPDGRRLLFGRYDGSDASLGVATVAADGTETRRGIDGEVEPAITRLATIQLPGVEAIPCAIWAPDGRWAALAGAGSVWVVDTETAAVRELPGYDPTDLEWRPGTDELAITGHARPGRFVGDNAPIDVYSVSTDDIRTLDGVEAVELTWSPDGTTLAYTHAVPDAANTKSGITLIDADGTNQRPLTTHEYVAEHGIGITWSPRGDQIAYQRERVDCTGLGCGERSEVVLVTSTDADPATPIGTERAIPPLGANPHTAICGGCASSSPNYSPQFRTSTWYANSVTWSPDGTKLLYSAWSTPRRFTAPALMVVPADGLGPIIVLSEDGLIGQKDPEATRPQLPLQVWQAAPRANDEPPQPREDR